MNNTSAQPSRHTDSGGEPTVMVGLDRHINFGPVASEKQGSALSIESFGN